MFKRIDHIELLAQDPERVERFYTEVLGFRVRERTSVPGGLQLTYLDLGGTTVELMHYADSAPAPREPGERLGYRMMAIEVDDMDGALGYLREKGIEPAWGPVKRPAYARAEIEDPEGNRIELRQWVKPAAA